MTIKITIIFFLYFQYFRVRKKKSCSKKTNKDLLYVYVVRNKKMGELQKFANFSISLSSFVWIWWFKGG